MRASGAAVDLGPPPTNSYEEETPVGEKFRRLAFEGVSYELERPAYDEENCRDLPCAVVDGHGEQGEEREQNQRDTKGVAEAVHRMLVAA